MLIRPYFSEQDKASVIRIWKEIGWLDKDEEGEGLDILASTSHSYVAPIAGEAESLVISTPGTFRYLKKDLPFAAISGVTTSRIARQQGFAKGLTAHALAHDAKEGAVVSLLGMFEQGFYNHIGYGTGGYEHWISLDPSKLDIHVKPRIPKRLSTKDWKDIHHSLIHRLRLHGFCNLSKAEFIKGELLMHGEESFGLGYYNGDGELTHHFWCYPHKIEHGPYVIQWMAFQNYEQFLELMALIKNLGDQVRLVRMREHRGIQLQSLLQKPFQQFYVSKKSDFTYETRAVAYWQGRILDLKGALALTHLPGEEISFNLLLTDPITQFLPDDGWRGIGGEYVVTLGPVSSAIEGYDDALPTLKASVGAFTRLWMGVLPARGLAVVDDLEGKVELLEALEDLLRLPYPSPDWDF